MSALDVATLKAGVDLLALVSRDTQLKKVASTRGGEWAGPCPWCSGLDRLRVQPEQGQWWCRRCSGDRWQDAIAYVQKRDGCGFRDACRTLGATDLDRPTTRLVAPAVRAVHDDGPAVEQPPGPSWQGRGVELVAECEAALWTSAGERALAWLRQRGLTDATIRAARLGFQPSEKRYEPAAHWGLPATEKRVWLPRGVVIPWLAGRVLWGIKVRRASGEPKYPHVSSSRRLLYGLDDLQDHTALALTEGELDALLLRQQARDLVDVLTLGSCAALPGGRALARLAGYGTVLVAYDADPPKDDGTVPPGDAGANKVLALLANGRRLRPTIAKDITDMHKAGWDLRAWLSFALAGEERTEQPPAPRDARRLVNDEAVPLRVVLTDGHVAVLPAGGFVRVPPGVDVREAARVEVAA